MRKKLAIAVSEDTTSLVRDLVAPAVAMLVGALSGFFSLFTSVFTGDGQVLANIVAFVTIVGGIFRTMKVIGDWRRERQEIDIKRRLLEESNEATEPVAKDEKRREKQELARMNAFLKAKDSHRIKQIFARGKPTGNLKKPRD